MTLPFCLAALAFIVIQGTTRNVISVPLSSMTTPEDHLSRVSRLSNGFELLYGAIRSSSFKGSVHCRRKSFLPIYKQSGTRRMNSALSEYEAEIHGEVEKGFFARMLQCCRKQRDSEVDRELVPSQSFRMSFAMRKASFYNEEKEKYARIFHHIDSEKKEYEITKAQFKEFLKSVGYDNEVGLDFACEAFQLMDLDGSGDIGELH